MNAEAQTLYEEMKVRLGQFVPDVELRYKAEIAVEINALKLARHAVILGHNYMEPVLFHTIPDFRGDSLDLSRRAAQTDKEIIVFCGVKFMAETAKILSPDKTVLLPAERAGCSLAESITAEDVRALKRRFPGVPVVTYVNSSAAVKAHTDICCTSANAGRVVNSLAENELIFTPDRNLGRFVAKTSNKKFHFWDGFCPTHERLRAEDVTRLKAEYPDALFICHPECNPAVSDLADHACSTSGMYDYCRTSPAKRFIIGTEAGILYRLKKENPDKEFILASPGLICPNMKLISLEDILASLRTMAPEVRVEEDIRIPAKRALDRMLAVPRD